MSKVRFDFDTPVARMTAEQLYELIVMAIVDAQTVVDPQARRADTIAQALQARRFLVE